jgi:hypothetical protein
MGWKLNQFQRNWKIWIPLSKQLIQKAKAFQAVYRLGTYTGKVPSHNSPKACKEKMFTSPTLKTVKTLEEVNKKVDGAVTRPTKWFGRASMTISVHSNMLSGN